MSTEDDAPREVLQAYRAANALLQEQASPATRAAILAAAACAEAARPRTAATPRAAPQAGWRSWLPSRHSLGRLPVAAMATVLVSVLAWQIAQFAPGRTDVAPSAPAVSPAQTADASRRAADIPPPAIANNDSKQQGTVQAGAASVASGAERRTTPGVAAAQKANDVPLAPRLAPSTAGERADAAARAKTDVAEAGPKPAASAELAAAKTVPAPKSEASNDQISQSTGSRDRGATDRASSGSVVASKAKPAAPIVLPSAPPGEATRAASRVRAEPVERSAPLAGDGAAAESGVPLDLDRWIARIVQLRHAGRNDEADAELKQLRARYPDAKLPPLVERDAIGTK